MTKRSGSGPDLRAGCSSKQRLQKSQALSQPLRSTPCTMKPSVVLALWPKDKVSLDKVCLIQLKVHHSLSKVLALVLATRLGGASSVKRAGTHLLQRLP